MWPQFRLGQPVDLKVAPPVFQDVRRRPVIKSAVDLAAAADDPALDVGNLGRTERHGESAISIFLLHFAERERGRGLQRRRFTLLDQDHITPRFGEQAGRDRAAGTRTHHGNFAAKIARRDRGGGSGPTGGFGGCRKPGPLVQREGHEAFVEAHEVPFGSNPRSAPGLDLPAASRQRQTVKTPGGAGEADPVERVCDQRQRPAQRIAHPLLLTEDESGEIVERRGELRPGRIGLFGGQRIGQRGNHVMQRGGGRNCHGLAAHVASHTTSNASSPTT